jgi:formyl-CoA transferase
VGPGIGDIGPAMFAAFGALAATFKAQRTGRGERVDISMADSVLAICERIVFQHSATGAVPQPEGNGHPLLCPFGLFEAADGWVTIAVPKDSFWQLFVALIGRAELAGDARFATNAARLANAAETEALVTGWTRPRTRAEIATVIGGKIPFGPVMTAADIFADPHFTGRGAIVEVPYPGAARALHIANTPVRMARSASGVRRPAPLTGEHTSEVLGEFGFEPAQVAALGRPRERQGG